LSTFQLIFIRFFIAVYGTGTTATFAWAFVTLSGNSVCAASLKACGAIMGTVSTLALTWPNYWLARISGTPISASTLPLEVFVASVIGFAGILILTYVPAIFEPSESEAENDEPLFNTAEPNRRNQSAAPPSA
jgi:hypothetical protein